MLVSCEALRHEDLQLSDLFQWEAKASGLLKANGISHFPVFFKCAKGTQLIQATGRPINIQQAFGRIQNSNKTLARRIEMQTWD